MTGPTSHDWEAEKAVIGALLRNARRVLELVSIEPRDFYAPSAVAISQACLELVADGRPVDQLTVADQLGAKLPAVGGHSGLADMADGFLTAENVAHYVAIIRDHALKRRVCCAVGEVMRVANDEHDSGEDAHAELLRQASGIEGVERGADTSVSLGEIAAEAHQRMRDVADGKPVVAGVMTGHVDLDNLTGGVARGVVTILAGRPSQGKSALARRVAYNAAVAGEPAHVFSLEDTRDRYADRMLADLAGVDLAKFSERKPSFLRGELDRIRFESERMKSVPLYIDDAAGLSSQQIANRVRMRKRSLGTKLVVIDYVQLIHEPHARDKRDEVDRAATALVRMARDEGVAVLLLSQLSRDSEKRDDKRPLLSDLRESGTLEQLADAVFMVHQGWRYTSLEAIEAIRKPEDKAAALATYEKVKDIGEVLVRKNKHGRQGDIRLRWEGHTATYRDLSLRESYGR